MRDRDIRRVTRRGFIKRGGALGVGAAVAPLVLKLGGCASDNDASPGDDPGDAPASGAPDAGDSPAGASDAGAAVPASGPLAAGAVLVGLYAGDGEAAMTAAAQQLDFGWLAAGDSVLIKVASNSGNPHPATTSPAGVKAMVAHLKGLGAGKVLVGDQAGVEWVRKTASGRFSSTRERFEQNGLIALEEDAELRFFDDGDWDADYFEATLPEGHRWPRGLWLTRAIQEVDHIIYMPRISAHTLAGLTNAHKSAIGWLRDDSRHDVHNDAVDFYEKYAEISYTEEIRSRLRLVATVNEKIQLFGGPDEGTEYHMDPPLVIASSSIANHDAVATSVLVALQEGSGAAPTGMLYNSGTASLFNSFFAGGAGVGGTSGEAGPWMSGAPSTRYTAHGFERAVDGERAVVRGWELSGGKPEQITLRLDGEPLDADLQQGIEAHGGGLYSIG